MSEEIDISKLHGKIKDYARLADRDDDTSSKGYNKLDTKYELNIFKDMIIRDGLQEELNRQVGKTVVKAPDKSKKEESSENSDNAKDLAERVNDFIKDNRMVSNPNRMQDIISAKLDSIKLDESEK